MAHGHFEYVDTGREYLANAAKEIKQCVAFYIRTNQTQRMLTGVLCINSSTNYPRSWRRTWVVCCARYLFQRQIAPMHYTRNTKLLDGLVLDYTY